VFSVADEPDFDYTFAAALALVAYVRDLFPRRFYPSERAWLADVAALLLSTADTVEHLTSEAATMPGIDALTLVRTVFERTVAIAWIMIDPEPRAQRWHHDSLRQSHTIVREMRGYGIEFTRAPAPLNPKLERLPRLDACADEADAHWADRVAGLYAPGHAYSFRGLYTIIYRVGSASAHGALSSVNGYIDRTRPIVKVARPDSPDDDLWPAFAAPLYAMALCIAATGLWWIDESRVREPLRPQPPSTWHSSDPDPAEH
jgi:hypothetical protein